MFTEELFDIGFQGPMFRVSLRSDQAILRFWGTALTHTELLPANVTMRLRIDIRRKAIGMPSPSMQLINLRRIHGVGRVSA